MTFFSCALQCVIILKMLKNMILMKPIAIDRLVQVLMSSTFITTITLGKVIDIS